MLIIPYLTKQLQNMSKMFPFSNEVIHLWRHILDYWEWSVSEAVQLFTAGKIQWQILNRRHSRTTLSKIFSTRNSFTIMLGLFWSVNVITTTNRGNKCAMKTPLTCHLVKNLMIFLRYETPLGNFHFHVCCAFSMFILKSYESRIG